jgi:hypothetical protein|tara:strand:- start:2177 stop:2365 length:189 start_codon:yes stop_codon:yes gene_type:complete
MMSHIGNDNCKEDILLDVLPMSVEAIVEELNPLNKWGFINFKSKDEIVDLLVEKRFEELPCI